MRFEDVIGQEEVKRILMSEADGGGCLTPCCLLVQKGAARCLWHWLWPNIFAAQGKVLLMAKYRCLTNHRQVATQLVGLAYHAANGNNWHILMCISCSPS